MKKKPATCRRHAPTLRARPFAIWFIASTPSLQAVDRDGENAAPQKRPRSKCEPRSHVGGAASGLSTRYAGVADMPSSTNQPVRMRKRSPRWSPTKGRQLWGGPAGMWR